MAGMGNVLAMMAQAPEPTKWKSPQEMALEQAQTAHAQASAQQAKAAALNLQQESAKMEREAAQAARERDAIARAAKDSASDHNKFVDLAVQYGASPAAVKSIQDAMDNHAKMLTEADKATREKADWQQKQVRGLLDPLMQANDPIEQRRLASAAQARAKQLGVELPETGDVNDLKTFYHLNGVEGSIAEAAKKKLEAENLARAGIAAEQEATRKQTEFNTEHPVKAAVAAATLGDPQRLAPAERATANAAAARLEQDKLEAAAAARRIAETERHNRRSEEIQAKIAAGAGSMMPELANTPKPLQAPAAAEFSKAGIEYANSKAAADDISAVIGLVRSGNKAAGSNLPLLGVGALNAVNGIKRMNKAEIDQYAGAGSLWDKVVGRLDGLAEGKPIPADVLNDIEALHKTLAEGAKRKYQDKVNAINQSHNSSFKADTGGSKRMIRALDPQGNLHEAEEGTPLPAGWKLER